MPLFALRRSPLHFPALILLIAFVVLAGGALTAQESILVTTTDGSLSLYDLATYNFQESFPTVYFDNAITVGVNPRLAFLSGETGFMTVVDLTIGKEIKRIYNVGAGGLPAITADGKSLIIWDDFNATLDIIDIASLAVTKRVNLVPVMGLNNADSGGSVVLVGSQAFLMTAFPDPYHPTVGVVDLTTFKVVAIPIPNVSFFGWNGNAALTPDGKYAAMVGDLYQNNQGYMPEIMLIDTSSHQLTSQPLPGDPDAIVITTNHSDPSKYFGYVTYFDPQSYLPTAVAVDFRPGSQTYGQVLPATEVLLTNLDRSNSYGSGLALNAEGTKLVVSGDYATPPAPNVMVLDTSLMFSDPMHAIVASLSVANGNPTEGLGVGTVNLTPPNSAPTVAGEQGNIINNQPTQITVTGTNFLEGALVRIGKLPPLNTTVDNANTLQVSVPANVPSDPAADLLVTNPGSNGGLDQQYQTGALSGGVAIGLNPAYQPQEQFAVLNGAGNGSIGLFDLKQRDFRTLTAAPNPSLIGMAFSADGAALFGAGYETLNAWDASTGQPRGSQLNLTGELPYRLPIISRDSPLSGKPVIYAAVGTSMKPYDIVLKIVDADHNSPNFNTVLGQIAAGQNFFERLFPYTETATPDGHYVYVTYQAPYNDGTFQHLLIFDIVNSTATLFNLDKYAIGSYNQFQPVISPDGKFLVLRGNQFNYPFATQLDVFDINTNPKVPRLVGAVTVPRNWRGTAPYPPDMFSYQILGNYLFVVSHFSNAVMTFNFKPANNDFRPISIYTLPGNSNSEAGKIAVSPDGNYLYVASNADDMVLVLDPNKLVENQDPLITTLASTDAVFAIAVSPVPPPPVSFKTRQRPQASARQ